MKILLVEDSVRLSKSVATYLRRSNYIVDCADNGPEGLQEATTGHYDTIILDIMLPGLDGLSLLKKLRDIGCDSQVLLLTAKGAVDDRVRGLDHGADDYLVKPFAMEELVARIRALCRRRHKIGSPRMRVDYLELDTTRRTACVDGKPVKLTPREYALLECLMLREGQTLTRTQIEDQLYDFAADPMSNVVDSAICSLRKKLTPPGETPLIQTRRGFGYVLTGRAP